MPINSGVSQYQLGQLLNGINNGVVSANGGYPQMIALFTAQPTQANFASVETTYGGYVRVTQAMSSPVPWTVAAGTPPVAVNASSAAFPTCTSNDNQSVSWVGIIRANQSTGAQTILLAAFQLDAPLVVSNGFTPVFPAGAITIYGDT